MILSFKTYGNNKQKECARAWVNPTVTEIIYGGSKGSAKSYTGASLIFGDALTYPGTHYFIARKTLNDLRKFTRPSVREVCDNWGIEYDAYLSYNGQDNYYQLYNGSRVYLLDAKYMPSDPEYARFGSMQFTRGWIEEAGEFEEVCKQNLQAAIGRWKNKEYNLSPKLLQTCNPSKNYLYKDYRKNKEGTLEEYKRFIQALPTDNKMLSEEYLQNLDRTLTGAARERLLFGNWEYDDDPRALMTFNAISDLFTNEHVGSSGQTFITADVARFGSDLSVVFVWKGWKVIEVKSFKKNSTTNLAEAIRKLAIKYRVTRSRIIADEDGVGGGVVDQLKCKGFQNGSRPINPEPHENYSNLRSQCWFKIAAKVESNSIWIADSKIQEQLTKELEVIKQKHIESDQKRQVISKEEIKKLLGHSPDYADTLMMRYYFELTVRVASFRVK